MSDPMNKTMPGRRSFLKGSVVSASALALGSVAMAKPNVIANKKISWRMVTTWPTGLPGYWDSCGYFAQVINEMSDGRLTIEILPAGELCKPMESFDFVSHGGAEIGNGAPFFWRSKCEGFNFFASVPFGLTGPEMVSWIYSGGGQELADELYGQYNLKFFSSGYSGPQMGGWFRKEIKSTDDFKGMKIRYPALSGEVLRRFGAEPTTIAPGEINAALKSGRLDAAEWTGPWPDDMLKLYESASYYYWPGWHEPSTANDIFINLKAWHALPNDLKKIVQVAARAAADIEISQLTAHNYEHMQMLVKNNLTKLRKFNDETLLALGKTTNELLEELAVKDERTKKIYDSFYSFRKQAVAWSEISFEAFESARALVFR